MNRKKRTMPQLITALLLIAGCNLLVTGCNQKTSTNTTDSTTTTQPAKQVQVPAFNADSAYLYIEKQLAFGPRVPNSQAHKACGDWIVSTLKRFNATVTEQKPVLRAFDGTSLNARNIIGSYNPESTSRVLLCAHWDSRPWADHDSDAANQKKPVPAANDGASGVGVLLEMARQFSLSNPGVGVDIVFFDAEDYGEPQELQGEHENSWALGSQYWAMNPHVPGYQARYGILLDMVGAKDAVFPQEYYSRYYAPNILRNVWSTAQRLGYDNFFVNRNVGAITDDHLYINELKRIPVIDIIDYDETREKGFFDYWHTVNDDIQNISKETLKAVGQVVITVVYES